MSRAWTKDIRLNYGTFGNSEACHTLVDMMNDNKIGVYEKHRVLSLINRASLFANGISQIPDAGVRHHMLLSARDEFISRVDIEPMGKYPEEFKSFLKNVINYVFNRSLKRVMRVNWAIALRGGKSEQ
jgi:hypothetical protein